MYIIAQEKHGEQGRLGKAQSLCHLRDGIWLLAAYRRKGIWEKIGARIEEGVLRNQLEKVLKVPNKYIYAPVKTYRYLWEITEAEANMIFFSI